VFPKPETETGSFICGNLQSSAYLVFQHPGFTPRYCRQQRRALLPHVFTLTSTQVRRRFFSAALSVIPFPESLPVRKRVALCCPDFPPFFRKEEQRRNSLPLAKVVNAHRTSSKLFYSEQEKALRCFQTEALSAERSTRVFIAQLFRIE
jgi:hypothetical protein